MRRRTDRGVVVVEAALLFPVLFMLVFGLVTFGLALGQRNSLENAARESSRFGATRPVTVVKDWLDAVHGVAVSAATGELGPGAPDRYVCVALVGTAQHDARRVTVGNGTPTYSASDLLAPGGDPHCPTSPGATEWLTCPSSAPCVEVVVSRSVELDAVAFKQQITLDARNVSAFEREP